jgi:hypothetical protein
MPISEELIPPAIGWTAWCQSARDLAREPCGQKSSTPPSNENLVQEKQHANR